MRRTAQKSGYALMIVTVSVVLLLLLFGLAYGYTTAALRIETVRTLQQQRDEGTIHAIARGLTLLETGLPPSSPHVCEVTILTSAGPSRYKVTFTSQGGANWSIQAVPTPDGEDPDPMPASFLPP
jgi:hypothetical protein